ncbi:MAP kinase 17 [Striga asiatica]|uniref:MAP kinase 17 n=1 Tax=Striga asiatica TaxID=4170 RepID=A0A5A7QJ24_STRAF|nr:MAP kinase 17 [Striga asiatica]
MHTRSGRTLEPIDKPSHESVRELFDKLSLDSSETTNPDMALQPRDVLLDLVHPTIGPITSCIRLPQEARNYELKMIHYNQLPFFHGFPNEDPLNFIREFYNDLQRQCPHHNLSLGLLINCFYDSLYHNLQYMVDNVAGGDIGAKTAEEINMMSQQLAELTEQMRLLNARGAQPVQAMAVDTWGLVESQAIGLKCALQLSTRSPVSSMQMPAPYRDTKPGLAMTHIRTRTIRDGGITHLSHGRITRTPFSHPIQISCSHNLDPTLCHVRTTSHRSSSREDQKPGQVHPSKTTSST